MQTSFQDLIFRHPTLADTQQTFALLVRCDVSEYGAPGSDLEDLLHDWKQIDLNSDAWLACALTGDLVGYGAVLPWGSNLRYEFYVDPAWKDPNLGQALLAQCEARGKTLVAARDEATDIAAQIYIAHVNQRDRQVIKQADFRPVKYHFNMQIQMESPPPAPHWPEGIATRTASVGQDEPAIHQLIQAAFDRPGRTPQPFSEWKASMMRSDIFQANLWFLALAGTEIVGACLCFAYAEEGWVRQLGVAERWRRKGLGTALLRHAFAEFKKRGFDKVGLAVEGDNLNAYTFYEKIGMKRIRQYDEYKKPIEISR